jgi:hypothetical protein
MVAERRVAAEKVAEAQAAARRAAHRRNIEATKTAMVETKHNASTSRTGGGCWRRWRRRDNAVKASTTSPATNTVRSMRRTIGRSGSAAASSLTDDAGLMTALAHQTLPWEPTPPARTSRMTSSFKLGFLLCKTYQV